MAGIGSIGAGARKVTGANTDVQQEAFAKMAHPKVSQMLKEVEQLSVNPNRSVWAGSLFEKARIALRALEISLRADR